jgi:hypothetical protein
MFTLQQLLAPRGQDNIKTLQALYEGSFVCAQRLIPSTLRPPAPSWRATSRASRP